MYGNCEPFSSVCTAQRGQALTLYEVLGLLGHISPGLAFEGEVPVFDFLHDLLSAGVGQTLLLTLERHLAGQHCVLHTHTQTHRFVKFVRDGLSNLNALLQTPTLAF